MKDIEPICAVTNERRIVLHPGFRPGPAEGEFKRVLDCRACDQAHARRERDGEAVGQWPADEAIDAAEGEHPHCNAPKVFGDLGQAVEPGFLHEMFGRIEGNRTIEKLIRDEDREDHHGKRDGPVHQMIVFHVWFSTGGGDLIKVWRLRNGSAIGTGSAGMVTPDGPAIWWAKS